jgi:photosystem II stability/assembly factor-like uncharacterized protein
MVDSDKFTSGDEDERDQRLIQDLHRMYHAKVEDAQPLARIRKRLAEGSASILYDSTRTPQQHDVLSMHRESSGNVNSNRSSFTEGRTWQQRTGTIAAVVFVTLLVGSLVVVLTHAHQSSPGGPENTLQLFGALSSIYMVDTQTGWAVTDKGRIVRTTDGGGHWKNITPNYPSTRGQRKVVADFLMFSNAWVAVSDTAADGTSTVSVFRTTDGQTWQQTTIQQTSPIYQLTFVDPLHGWMLSKQADHASAEAVAILRTTDGGKTWVVVSSALAASTDTPLPGQLPFGGDKAGLGLLDTMTGWITGNFPLNGYVFFYVTHDGGATWNRQTFPFSPDQASTQVATRPPRFFSATDGILPVSFVTQAASSLAFYVTHDGGANWQSTTPLAASATIADFIDMDHGWASDGTLLYMTSDGGHHWTKLSPGANFKNVSRLNFVSSNIGWAIGSTANNSPSLLKTVDGGQTWTVIPYTIS